MKTMNRGTNMKELYEELEMEVTEFDNEDVITTSTQYPGEYQPIT